MLRLFRPQSSAIKTIAKAVNPKVSSQRPKPPCLFFKNLKPLTQNTLSDANKAWADAIEYGVPPRTP
ncbi:MAG: hypothetical protein A3F46_11305 [Legionellales bacterium RIFCSPHIGHO2_12_FULL_42_9]|nr:MAG: hypothetical protein A3F46_11305 [Legionellales bacterium RIFCSPHIGHO2_12_FULL_42_9]